MTATVLNENGENGHRRLFELRDVDGLEAHMGKHDKVIIKGSCGDDGVVLTIPVMAVGLLVADLHEAIRKAAKDYIARGGCDHAN